MGSGVGQIFPTARHHRDHSILYALVCENELSHMSKTTAIQIWCVRKFPLYLYLTPCTDKKLFSALKITNLDSGKSFKIHIISECYVLFTK